MSFIYNMADLWNAGATKFTAILMNATDSASLATSLLIDLQYNTTSIFNVNRSYVNLRQFGADTQGVINVGSGFFGSLQIGGSAFGNNGLFAIQSAASGFATVRSDGSFSWVADNNPGSGTIDLSLLRDAANVLAQRNGVNAQTFRVYNTFTDATNFEAFKVDWATFTNFCQMGPAKSTSGNLRAMMASFNTITVASLPTAASAGSGAKMYCTNSSGVTFSTTVTGSGGAVGTPIYSDGTQWRVG